MKLIATKTELVNKLTIAARMASTSSAIQAGHGILIDAQDSTVELSATNFDTSITLPLVTESVDGKGRVLVPAKLLLDVVKACPAKTVSIALRESKEVHIESGAATFDLRTLRLDDFPPLPVPSVELRSRIQLAPFVAAIDKVAAAASKDETRPVLTGVNVRVAGNSLRAVATDSYRLAVFETTLDEAAGRDFQLTLPATALQELARLAKVAGDEHLTISEVGHNFVMEFASIRLSTRTIDGQFPDPESLIPRESEISFKHPADELAESVRRVAILCGKSAPAVLTLAADGLKLQADTADVGSAAEILDSVQHSGADFTIGVNPAFLSQALDQYGDETVEVRFISPIRPVMLTDPAGALSQILMPIRLNTTVAP